jgi:transposase
LPGRDRSRGPEGRGDDCVRGASQDGPLNRRSITLSEKKKYRTWTVPQKLEIVLAGLRGDRSVAELCREHQISENLYYTWRDKLLEGGSERLSGKEERIELVELRKRVRDLERTLGRKTYELEILGNGFRTWE